MGRLGGHLTRPRGSRHGHDDAITSIIESWAEEIYVFLIVLLQLKGLVCLAFIPNHHLSQSH